jgi:hypothetical protein
MLAAGASHYMRRTAIGFVARCLNSYRHLPDSLAFVGSYDLSEPRLRCRNFVDGACGGLAWNVPGLSGLLT